MTFHKLNSFGVSIFFHHSNCHVRNIFYVTHSVAFQPSTSQSRKYWTFAHSFGGSCVCLHWMVSANSLLLDLDSANSFFTFIVIKTTDLTKELRNNYFTWSWGTQTHKKEVDGTQLKLMTHFTWGYLVILVDFICRYKK